jgi:Prokaryotic E2 family E
MWNFLAKLLAVPDSEHPHVGVHEHSTRPIATTPAPPAPIRRNRKDRRTRYIQAQAYQLAERFSKDGGSGIQLDEQNYNWLIIPKYPMPERWRQRWTSLMILFPAAYPDVPPTGFYLTIRARLKDGGKDKHLFNGGGFYANAPDLSAQGWFWYCVHAQVQGAGGWQPSSDPAYPDNLFTFLNMVREALSTDA